jgi:hypothetical protein
LRCFTRKGEFFYEMSQRGFARSGEHIRNAICSAFCIFEGENPLG